MQSPKTRAARSRRFWGAKVKKGTQQFYTGRFLPKSHPFTFLYTTKGTVVAYLRPFQYTPKRQISLGANLGVECTGCAPPPPPRLCGDLRLSNATGIRKNGPLDFNGLDSNHHALLEVERGRGEGIPPRCFSCSLFFPLSSQFERLEHARQRETTVPVSWGFTAQGANCPLL